MTATDMKAAGLSRRKFLKGAGSTLLAMTILPSGMVVGTSWAQMPRATSPETFASLVQMSRDCYPHDAIDDSYYATAVDILDAAARSSEEELALLEDGMGALNEAARTAHDSNYDAIEDEAQRVALLKAIETDPFFQKVRSNLVVGLYNQKELWPVFGYEGASFDQGGYLARGFDDITWLS